MVASTASAGCPHRSFPHLPVCARARRGHRREILPAARFGPVRSAGGEPLAPWRVFPEPPGAVHPRQRANAGISGVPGRGLRRRRARDGGSGRRSGGRGQLGRSVYLPSRAGAQLAAQGRHAGRTRRGIGSRVSVDRQSPVDGHHLHDHRRGQHLDARQAHPNLVVAVARHRGHGRGARRAHPADRSVLAAGATRSPGAVRPTADPAQGRARGARVPAGEHAAHVRVVVPQLSRERRFHPVHNQLLQPAPLASGKSGVMG